MTEDFTLYAEARRVGTSLSPGTSDNSLTCPRCGERGSFSVFATADGYGWKCHRVKCGLGSRFFRRSGPPLVPPPDAPPTRAVRPYPYPLTFPEPSHILWPKLGVPPALRTPAMAASLGFFAREGFALEVVWRLRDFNLETIGHVSRDYTDKTVRTWRLSPTGSLFSYFPAANAKQLWIVEDCVSAGRLRGEGGVDSIALLGTNIAPDLVDRLDAYLLRYWRQGVNITVVIALDADATTKAAAYAQRLTRVLPSRTLLCPLRMDIKDMEPGEVAKLVSYFSAGVKSAGT